ncbi:MAG: metallophosphoesterase [Myxococcota bacterium]
MQKTFIIGDIHGCWEELARLLDASGYAPGDAVISVGDLVDRGPDSARVWAFFRDTPGATAIMGNHERKHVRGVLSFSQEIVRVQLGPEYDAFRKWCAALPYALETDACVVVHGGFEPGVQLSEQREDVLSGTTGGTRYLERQLRGRDWAELYAGPVPIVFGHRVVGDEARRFPHAWALDTGACHGGTLTALELPSFTLHRVPAARNHWRGERRRWQLPVLEARPWDEYRFAKVRRELADLRSRPASPEVRGFLDALEAWSEATEALAPELLGPLRARAAALAAEVGEADEKRLKQRLRQEPDAPLLFAARRGSLDEATVRAQLQTPGAMRAAAARLGVATGDTAWATLPPWRTS